MTYAPQIIAIWLALGFLGVLVKGRCYLNRRDVALELLLIALCGSLLGPLTWILF